MLKKTITIIMGIALLAITAIMVSSCQKQEIKTEETEVYTHPKWSYDATIYEMNIRQYTEEGTLNAAAEHLPRLKEMGIDIVWLMPIHPIGEKNRKGTMGSYYSVKDYKAVNPEFGTSEDFKKFVDKAHSLGMYVIIDWVANHTSWDNVWVESHPEYFTKDSLGNFVPPVDDWSDVIDLNYDNQGLRNAMTDALEYWVRDFNIDGYRCDVAAMVPTDFWVSVRKKLDAVKPVFMLAEASEPELHAAFDMTYKWQLKDMMNNIAAGEKNVTDLVKHFAEEDSAYNVNDFRMNFTTNHDENSWNKTVYERLGEGYKTFYVLTATVPGMPLVYSGQESAYDKELEFFEKDVIEWGDYKDAEFIKTLLQLKKENKALLNGEKGGKLNLIKTSLPETTIAYSREIGTDKVVVILNLSSTTAQINLEGNALAGEYKNVFNLKKMRFSNKEKLSLKPWEYLVLTH